MIDAGRTTDVPAELQVTAADTSLEDVDVNRAILWEAQARPQNGTFYPCVAAEAGAIKIIRHHLLQEIALPRSATNLMGYWWLGQVGLTAMTDI